MPKPVITSYEPDHNKLVGLLVTEKSLCRRNSTRVILLRVAAHLIVVHDAHSHHYRERLRLVWSNNLSVLKYEYCTLRVHHEYVMCVMQCVR